jgi:hypothetical protein
MNALKFAEGGIIEGIAAPYGSPSHRDSHGEYFTGSTDFQLGWFAERPLLLGHGLDAAGAEVVGKVVSTERRPDGLWIRAQLDKASRWFGQVRDQLAAGILSFSSATMPHLAKVEPDGRITAWPLVEISLTSHPASRDARIVSVRSAAAHYQAIGAPVAAFKMHLVPPSELELDYQAATAEANRVEARAAELEFRAIKADLNRRFGR